jgi:dihydroxy-acid dehydratase
MTLHLSPMVVSAAGRLLQSETSILSLIGRRSHGFCIGHVVPEAQVGGPIALVQDGDVISVDAVKNTIELHVSPEELERRRKAWVAPPLKVQQGTLFKYVKTVTDASHGCITDA